MGFITFALTFIAVLLFVLFLYGGLSSIVLYIAVVFMFAAAGFGAAWASKP